MENRRADDTRIESILKSVEKTEVKVDKIHDSIHGNGSEGLKTKVGKLGIQVKLLYGFFILAIGCAIKKAFF